MVKWEYRLENIDMMYMDDGWETLGASGWELVAVDETHAYFKRPVKPQMPAVLIVNNVDGHEFERLAENVRAVLEPYGLVE